MDYTETARLITVEKAAEGTLHDLIETAQNPQPGTPEGALIEEAAKDCEIARQEVLADYQRQLREK